MKNRIFKTLVTLAAFVAMQQESFAGFPIGNGRWLLVPTYTRYTAQSYWDANGVTKNFDASGRYQSNYLGLFGGYGIGRDVDLVFNIPYVTQSYFENGSKIEQLSSVGDVSVGLSYFLNHYDYYKHLSITASLIFPMYDNIPNTYLLPGFGSAGAEVKLGLAGTNTQKLKDTYYDVEGGIRHYFNAGGPTMLFANATFGVPINEDWKISGTLNAVSASSNGANSTSSAAYNPYINRDFSYLRGTIGLGRRLDRNITLWGSIFRDFTGTSIDRKSVV